MHDQRVALVTGANQGIGLQIARELAARGFTVLVGSRNLASGETAARSIGGAARALQLDVTDAASVAAAAARVTGELGRLDVLVNNAAISNTHPAGTSPSPRRCCRSFARRPPAASSTCRAERAR